MFEFWILMDDRGGSQKFSAESCGIGDHSVPQRWLILPYGRNGLVRIKISF